MTVSSTAKVMAADGSGWTRAAPMAVSHGLQLQSLWRIPTAAVSERHRPGRPRVFGHRAAAERPRDCGRWRRRHVCARDNGAVRSPSALAICARHLCSPSSCCFLGSCVFSCSDPSLQVLDAHCLDGSTILIQRLNAHHPTLVANTCWADGIRWRTAGRRCRRWPRRGTASRAGERRERSRQGLQLQSLWIIPTAAVSTETAGPSCCNNQCRFFSEHTAPVCVCVCVLLSLVSAICVCMYVCV